jgi:hypothetical protein
MALRSVEILETYMATGALLPIVSLFWLPPNILRREFVVGGAVGGKRGHCSSVAKLVEYATVDASDRVDDGLRKVRVRYRVRSILVNSRELYRPRQS